jgi:quinol monooxygenase YgiN
MTIVMTVSFRLPADKRDAAITAALAMQAATTRERGCSEYRFWTAVDDPNALGLFERWETQEALDTHLATAHMAAFGQAMAAVLDKPAALTRYEVASSARYSGGDDD